MSAQFHQVWLPIILLAAFPFAISTVVQFTKLFDMYGPSWEDWRMGVYCFFAFEGVACIFAPGCMV